MIPEPSVLEQYYDPQEVTYLAEVRKVLLKVKDLKERAKQGRRALRELWDDEITYIEKTHWLLRQKEPGPPRLLKLNYAQRMMWKLMQEQLAQGLPIRIITLKARQLGFSTWIQSWIFEQVDREPNRSALTLSYDDPSSEELFQKSRFLHRSMWFPHELGRDSKAVLEMVGHNSSITVRTSGNLSAGRGDTYHYLHCSEIPMWADAGETLNSALQAIPETSKTAVFLESTAKGAVGVFYDTWMRAERGESAFAPFFAPWFWDPDYSLKMPKKLEQRFEESLTTTEKQLRTNHSLSLAQLNWRRRVIESKCQGSEQKFRQEFPSTAKEAFLTTGSPVFSADAIAMLEQNSTRPLWVGDIHLEVPA